MPPYSSVDPNVTLVVLKFKSAAKDEPLAITELFFKICHCLYPLLLKTKIFHVVNVPPLADILVLSVPVPP